MLTFTHQLKGTMAIKILLVGLGGGLGSILRFLTSSYFNRWYFQGFPIGTFLVNIIGCLLIGILIGLTGKVITEDMRLLLITGFCGGYTTFSAFSAENLLLFQNGQYLTLVSYILLSVIIGFFAVWLGNVAMNTLYE